MSEDMSRFEQQIVKITSHVVKRWGLSFPEKPKNPKNAVIIGLKQAIAGAVSQPFVPVYPNDHSWSSIGLRGLTVSRLKADDEPTGLQKAGEEWGVVALAEGMGCAVVIPLMADLSEDTARVVADHVDKNKSDFIDASQIPFLFSKKGGVDPKSEEAIASITIAALSWDEIRDLAKDANLPLSEAIFFRKPVAWDLLRAQMSAAKCPPLHEFSEKEFESRKDRSVKFTRDKTEATKALLKVAAKKDVNLDTPAGRNWFSLVVDGLNSLGIGRPMEGISVILNFEVIDKEVGAIGVRSLCIGYGLDPVQASYLLDLAQENPSAFHLLDYSEDRIFHFFSAMAVPDMYLAAVGATVNGRDPESYARLVEATRSKAEFINV